MTWRRSLALLAALALAGCGQDSARDADPALWVVRDADTTVYLFGTVHALKPGIHWFDDGVATAFDASDELVLELVVPPQAEMAALVQELSVTPGVPLAQQVPPETLQQVRDALTRFGQPASALDPVEPWMAALTLSTLPVQALGYDQSYGGEATLTQAARQQGKPVLGLETAREQLGYFDRLPPAAQRAMLAQVIQGMPQVGATLETMVREWSRGDADAIARLVDKDLESMPGLSEQVVGTRNRHWTDWIAARMQRPGTVFVAVGAGHLAGPQSLQTMLGQRGLKVERVAY